MNNKGKDAPEQEHCLPEKYANRYVLTKEEAAELYRTSVRTIERRIEEGRIPVAEEMLPQVRIPTKHFKK